jgi:hypothetical protein
MGDDEAGTLARLQSHRRELIDTKVTEHKGRIVKTTGDGILIEFPSVVEAVACAVSVQRGMTERNAETPEHQRIMFRVGINLGDVIVEGDDIHGQNLRARSGRRVLGRPASRQELGFDVLLNESAVLTRGAEHITVTGLDDVHRFFTPDALDALFRSGDGFRIALVHSAEVADHASTARYALYLCGHTHGGQICLPGGRPIITHLLRCRHASVGLWREGTMVGYTSRGLGVGGVP